jgi:N-acetylglucosamine kinase-like BadF-type ATPase
MKKYYLGIDVGGTKSHALICDEYGNVAGFGSAGPGNHEVVGYEGLTSVLQEITQKALKDAGIPISGIDGAGLGIGGYDWPSERPPTLEAVNTLQLQAPYEVVNDALIGLIAGSPRGWGIALVAGTGCNCWGWDPDHNVGHVSGGGLSFGECCGAADLVKLAIQAISAQWSMRGPATGLSSAFVDLVGARDVSDLLEGLCLGYYQVGGEAAPLVFQVAGDGDAIARVLVEQTGQYLGELACGVIHQLSFEHREFDLVLIGGLLEAGELLIKPLHTTVLSLSKGANFILLEAPAVTGGAMLGMQLRGIDPTPIREKLIESVRGYFHQASYTGSIQFRSKRE